jgi:phosphatidylglycerophosphate synthase
MSEAVAAILHVSAFALAVRVLVCPPFWWSGFARLIDFAGGDVARENGSVYGIMERDA